MNFMEKLAASHMTEEAFKAWSGDGEQEKEAGKVSKYLREKGTAALTRLGRVGQKEKGPAWKDLAKGKKRALIGAGVVGAGAVGAAAMKGKKKGYKDRM